MPQADESTMSLEDAIRLSHAIHARLQAELEESLQAERDWWDTYDQAEDMLPLPKTVCGNAQLLSDDWRLDDER